MKTWMVVIVIGIVVAVEPLTHLWIMYYPPEGAVPTGMHTGDSGHHLLSLRALATDFNSPFATCQSPHGPKYFGYFATPFFLLYAAMGAIGRCLHENEFLFLGVLNGVGGALYLVAAFVLFGQIIPQQRHRAFFIFALGGGLGGAAYLLTGMAGLHNHPEFEQEFMRFAWYELIEGQHISPLLLMPRFYYTVPMALGFGALAAYLYAERQGNRQALIFACLLLMCATFINIRLGPMLWLVAALYGMTASERPLASRVRALGMLAVATGVGGCGAWLVLRAHPVYTHNVAQVTQQVIRLLPMISATVFLWVAVAPAMLRSIAGLPKTVRFLACAVLGYLAAYCVLYIGYQAYYGNWLYGGDTTAAAWASYPALIGLLIGVMATWLLPNRPREEQKEKTGWVVVWLAVFLAAGVSAFGGGYLRLSPERCVVMVGPPLAILAALGLSQMRPVIARILFAVILACGVMSLSVAALVFQGPLGHAPGKGPFAYLHYEYMTQEDDALLKQLPQGTVAVPLWSPIAFGEIVALQPGMQVLGGPGAMNIGDRPFGEVEGLVKRFFDMTTDDTFRHAFVKTWCVDFVYCPDTCPVDRAVIDQFRGAPWLREIAQAGKGHVFQVIPQE